MAYLKYRPNDNCDFAFISIRYTITDLPKPEKRKYLSRGAKWSDGKNILFRSSKYKKRTSAETQKLSNCPFLDC